MVKEKIRKYIEENLTNFDDEVDFSDEDNIFELGFVNSLFAMKLLNFVESEFDISIEPEDIEIINFSTVNNILRLIEKKRGNSDGV